MKKPAPRQNGFVAGRLRSFGYAFKGIAVFLATQPNAWVHLTATVAVVALGFGFGITSGEWVALILAMGMVWAAEAMNTAIEWLTDLVSPDYHPLAGKVKDVAAGAVLLAAIAAAIVGLLVLGPHIWRWVSA